MSRRRPPPGFSEFVLGRSKELFRTSLLLTRDPADAQALLQDALAQAWRSWEQTRAQPESDTRRMLVRRFVSARQDPPVGQVAGPPVSAQPAGVDEQTAERRAVRRLALALGSLTPQQRAVVVLRHFHDYLDGQVSEVLQVTQPVVRALHDAALTVLAVPDRWILDRTLDELADAVLCPDSQELLAGAQARAQQADARRRRAWLGAVAAVMALGTAAVVLGSPPAGTETSADLAVPDPTYTDGYGLVDGEPAPFTVEGLRLVAVQDVAPVSQWTTRLPLKSADSPLYAVAWCPAGDGKERPGEDRPDRDPVQLLSTDDAEQASLPCTAPEDDVSVPVRSLPVNGAVWHVDNVLASETVTVAFYEEVAWADFPFAATGSSPSWSPPTASAEVTMIDADTPTVERGDLEGLAGTTSVHAETVPMTTGSQIEIRVSLDGPGQLLVLVDGVVVTDDGELVGPTAARTLPTWSDAEPGLRDGFLHHFGPGLLDRTFVLDSDVLTDLGVDLSDGEVVVGAVPRAVAEQDWAVAVATEDFTPAADTVLATAPAGSLPDYAYGLRKMAEFDVPTDGRDRRVDLLPAPEAETTWVMECPGDGSAWEDPPVLSVGGLNAPAACSPYDPWLSALVVDPDRDAAEARPSVSVSRFVPTGAVRVAAYAPVDWADYPFEDSTATPFDAFLPQEGQVAVSSTTSFDGVYVETGVVTLADLDDRGQAVLAVEPARYFDLVVRTRGVGRFRLEVADSDRAPVGLTDLGSLAYGRLTERDGWWSSWTARSSRWLIPGVTREEQVPVADVAEGIVVTVEGYEGGSLEIQALSVLPADR